MKSRKRAGLYMRVSTYDQHPENQRAPLEKLCRASGYQIAARYVDKETGTSAQRKGFEQLLRDVDAGKIDVIVCWSLDRFTREGIVRTFQYLEQLHAAGVGFVSHQEPFLSTVNPRAPGGGGGPDVQKLVVAVISWLADFEAARKRERIKAGLARRRESGGQLGRHPFFWTEKKLEQVIALDAAGESLRKIAAEIGASKDTVAKGLRFEARRRELGLKEVPIECYSSGGLLFVDLDRLERAAKKRKAK